MAGTESVKEKTGLSGRDVAMGEEDVNKMHGDEKVQETRKKGKYKILAREQEGRSDGREMKITGGKRCNSDMEVDGQGKEERTKGGLVEESEDHLEKAELANQLCELK